LGSGRRGDLANAFCVRELSSGFSSFLIAESKEKFVKQNAFTSTQECVRSPDRRFRSYE